MTDSINGSGIILNVESSRILVELTLVTFNVWHPESRTAINRRITIAGLYRKQVLWELLNICILKNNFFRTIRFVKQFLFSVKQKNEKQCKEANVYADYKKIHPLGIVFSQSKLNS